MYEFKILGYVTNLLPLALSPKYLHLHNIQLLACSYESYPVSHQYPTYQKYLTPIIFNFSN